MANPIFSEIKDSGHINIRANIETKVWRSFRAVAELNDLNVQDMLSQCLKSWIINHHDITCRCENCQNKIDKTNYFAVIRNDVYIYCCSIECCNVINIEKESL